MAISTEDRGSPLNELAIEPPTEYVMLRESSSVHTCAASRSGSGGSRHGTSDSALNSG
jgi:hypothetical protein